jgi:hypothetical protein
LTKAVVSEALNKGLFVDTISYSHYCGTTIVMLRSYLHNYLQQFFLFVYSIFVGTGRAGYNLPRLAVLTAPKLFNRGGGFTYSHFYYWFGYLGVVVFSFIMGVMIKRVYKNNDRLSKVLQLTVSAFAMRWYVYYPIAFFRSALLIPAVLYFACDIYDKLSSSQGINIK